ncbi:DNA-binding protein [Pelistega ratti]|uniref:helix-turn-helix domain-containing transcriptional regulator n=1 Tax=Pelistega ratti TaxID=2652177 RepID=UPI001358C65D|nr:hypothetical protein [Pelistega ratti]
MPYSWIKLKPFYSADYFTSDEEIESYIKQAIKEGEKWLLLHALVDVGNAQGLHDIKVMFDSDVGVFVADSSSLCGLTSFQ